ncbi:hypothetical protein SEA_JUMBO_13 [Gordonia phage Jumbo]|uniref:Uncharacterized protein n=1 Tax=Gordonia phage Jumbo TaxID=1887650 RepID=A0A1B3B0M2_9CAUD|nr:hypothetical protein BIZ69_gp013 [Gordonia phage Jumbo]AOE44526.1 hypothetical protein SEA_JUMBO_13 [Gordonia phage Jumbo]
MAERKADGSVTKPSGVVVPGGGVTPARAPGSNKPTEVARTSPLKVGPSESLVGDAISPEAAYNNNGFIGVDPIYQNAANPADYPKDYTPPPPEEEGEPEPDPETPPETP